jgi:hypothetical protein
MRRLFWILAWAGVALWSLVSFGAYGLLDFLGGVVARNADAFGGEPETVEWLFWFLSGLKNLGLTAIVVIWGIGSLCLLAVPWLIDRLVGGGPAPGQPVPPREAGVVELAPGEYRRFDGPPGPSRPGPVPRIEPRR